MIAYIGGKKFHVKYITPHFPKLFDGYCEPFSGAFWMFLQSEIRKSQIIYNDINPNMANLFYCSSQNPTRMKLELEKYPPQNPELFVQFRNEIFNRGFENKMKMPDFDLAAKFAYIQTQVFSGNTLSSKSKITLIDKTKYRSKYEQLIDKFTNNKFLQKISCISNIENLDFEECIKKYDRKGMLFYIDPPYFDCEDYYTIGNSEIHNRLARCISSLQGFAVISYYFFEKIKDLYPIDKFFYHKYEINCQNGNRKQIHSSKREELLVTNF